MVTSALPYANGPLHIGHLAGAYLSADIYVRYLRMTGKDVLWVCGSDEHGAAITLRAKKENISPKEIIDKYHGQIKHAFDQLGISFDIYHRTSEPLHHQTAQAIFLKLLKNDVFEVKESEQYYDEDFNQFLADRYITGTCPNCQNENAYGDQCENCGSTLSPTELGNPVSTLSGKKPILKQTKHWYLPLNKYEDWLKQWIVEDKKDEWKANVYGQCKSWIDGGLLPRAMTRDLDWGVKVPLENEDGKVLYVWLDAPIGYISASKQWALDNNKEWEPYWKDKDTKLIHFIGKDNIVFHCITFPAILKAHGDFILPDNVPANEFMNLQGDKISTSRNWAVWAHEYAEEFPNKVDELRYTLIANMPENKDSEFTWEDYQAKVNNELVANFGNFANRVIVLINKYWDGIVPNVTTNSDEESFIKTLDDKIDLLGQHIYSYKFRDALNTFMDIARSGNKYLADNEPWKLIKQDEAAAKQILHVAAQILGKLSICAKPFLPFSANQLADILNFDNGTWENAKHQPIKGGQQINKPQLLFEKIDDEFVTAQVEKLNATKSNNNTQNYTPVKSEITFEDFSKLDLRTGKILAAEKHPKADKLLVLEVDLGFEKRTIVSGIAEQYKPADIIDKNVAVIVNLAPRKLRGIESQGMILMSEDQEGHLQFMASDAEPGMQIS